MSSYYEDETGELRHYYGHPRPARRRGPPPPPPGPTPEQVLATFSTTFSREDRYSGLTFATLDELIAAVAVYGGHASPNYEDVTSGMPDLGAALFVIQDLQRDSSGFVARLCEEIRGWSLGDTARGFHRDWDYDGPGPFLKTSLQVSRTPRGFHLHVYRAYTGSQCEGELGRKLGNYPLDFVATILTATWAADRPRWCVPAAFFDHLSSVTGRAEGEVLTELHDALLGEDRGDPFTERGRGVVFTVDGLEVSLGLVGYRRIANYQLRRMRDAAATDAERERLVYTVDAAGLHGPARESHQWPGRYEAVGVEVWIRPVGVDPLVPVPQDSARALGTALAAPFAGLPRAYPAD